MRRLEYERRIRTAPGHARNAAEAVMYLAQVARERHRLGQEQRTLVKRMQRIEARLTAIAATETKLAPMIQVGPSRTPAPRAAGLVLQY
jgi:hypothetical protein